MALWKSRIAGTGVGRLLISGSDAAAYLEADASIPSGVCDMVNNQFQIWRRECEAVHKEMDRLIKSGRPQSREEQQVRQLQFTALIERRDAAARNLLRISPRQVTSTEPMSTT